VEALQASRQAGKKKKPRRSGAGRSFGSSLFYPSIYLSIFVFFGLTSRGRQYFKVSSGRQALASRVRQARWSHHRGPPEREAVLGVERSVGGVGDILKFKC